ncbi:hypothetical protein FGADI_3665 [Fusarium gaditjirri]|uniref:Uncharacterized protein n=1 Tax=Fusarium gaditjirri TaxID=282569 RepID=A0A8H4TEX4_9HYPO|nr:hypothetical protein FGADI_3665 [Fusarium gaditjirri]
MPKSKRDKEKDKNKKKNKKMNENGEQQGESSKDAAASPQGGTPTTIEQAQTTPDMNSPPYSRYPPSVLPPAGVLKHRAMVFYQLTQNHITLEDQARNICEVFVTTPNDSKKAAVKSICTFFGKEPGDRVRLVFDGSEQDRDENIRTSIREGRQSGRITDDDIRNLVTEQVVPIEGTGPYREPLLQFFKLYLSECNVPFVYTGSVSDGSAPGSGVRSYMAKKVPGEIIEVNESPNTYKTTHADKEDSQAGSMVGNAVDKSGKSAEGEVEVEVGESDRPEQPILEDTNSTNTNGGESEAHKTVDDTSPVSSVPSKEKADEGGDDISPVSDVASKGDESQAQIKFDDGSPVNDVASEEKADERGDDRSPMSGEPSEGKIDEGDSHSSRTTETLQSDDFVAQDTEPDRLVEDESYGNPSRSDTINEWDYDAQDLQILTSCDMAAEQSEYYKGRASSIIRQCDEMAQIVTVLRRLVKQKLETEEQISYYQEKLEDIQDAIREAWKRPHAG